MSSCGLNAYAETPVPLAKGIVNNAPFNSSPHINQTLHQIIHILHFFLVHWLLK